MTTPDIKIRIESLLKHGESRLVNRILLTRDRDGYKDYLNSDEFLAVLERLEKKHFTLRKNTLA